MKPNIYSYNEVKEGMSFEFKKSISEEDLDKFAELTGDYNPLHRDENFAREKGFKKKVVYGMLAGSLFSTLVGMVCPGKNNLYLSQSLNFRNPIHPGEELTIKGEIIGKTEGINVLSIRTTIISEDSVKIEGLAKVKFLEEKNE